MSRKFTDLVVHKQANANDKNRLAAFAILNFPYLNNGVMKTTKLEQRRYMPDVPANGWFAVSRNQK